MTPEEYLKQVAKLRKKVDSKRSERQAIEETVLGATSWEDNPSFSNQFHSTTENAAMKLLEHNSQVNEQVDELVDLQIKIANEIDQLEDSRYRMILRGYYIAEKKFEVLAVDLGYDYRHIIRLHKEALCAFGLKHKDVL